jgi:hypothetical protein
MSTPEIKQVKEKKEKEVTIQCKELKKLKIYMEETRRMILSEIKKKKDKKRPKTAYQLYLDETRTVLKEQYDKEGKLDKDGKKVVPSSTDVYKEAGKKWKSIVDGAKKEEVDKKPGKDTEEFNKWLKKAEEEKKNFKEKIAVTVTKVDDIQIKPRVSKKKKGGEIKTETPNNTTTNTQPPTIIPPTPVTNAPVTPVTNAPVTNTPVIVQPAPTNPTPAVANATPEEKPKGKAGRKKKATVQA